MALALLGIGLQFVGHAWEHADVIVLMVYGVLDPALLFIYLSLPGLQRFLKRYYLPLAILGAALGPILSQHLGFWIAEGFVSEVALRLMAWQMMPTLFIPLVVVAWQYSKRDVTLFCLMTAALSVGPLFFILRVTYLMPMAAVTFVQIVAFLLVGNMIVNLMENQRAQRAQLTEANQRLAQYASTLEALTISRERNRLARELHDVLAHTLSGVAVELEGLRAMQRVDPVKSQALLDHSLKAVREGLTESRRALKELRAKPLEDLGLALAVRGLAESAAGRAGFLLDLRLDSDLGDVPEGVQQSLYRIAQEALANVVDHAQAQLVQLALVREDGQIRMTIRDDGRGFDPRQPEEEFRYGLLGMRERAEMLGGTLSVESSAGQGTSICYSVSLHRAGIGGG